MKALCVAAVVLSFISVGQPAPLTCDTLVKPIEKGPEVSGRWYYIAASTEICLPTTLLDSFVSPSFAVDITSKNTPNTNQYEAMTKVKMYGYCGNVSESFLYEVNKMYDVDSENARTGDPDTLMYTSCPDCLVVKDIDLVDSLVFLSRRPTVTDAELKEFEKQAECLGWAKPLVFNTDHEYDNCPIIHDDMSEDAAEKLVKDFFPKMMERLQNTHHKIIRCLVDMVMVHVLEGLAMFPFNY